MTKKSNPKPAPKESEPIVPADLRQVLAGSATVKALWDDLTPMARRDFIGWIASARQEETRKRRVESMPSRLTSGKRRPCCYNIVPFGLYKALGANPKAKAAWSGLSSFERRDFTDWINAARDPGENKARTEKVCTMVAAGKKHP